MTVTCSKDCILLCILQLSVLVDTGSTTLAIASYPRQDSNEYFHSKNSTSIFDSGKEVREGGGGSKTFNSLFSCKGQEKYYNEVSYYFINKHSVLIL